MKKIIAPIILITLLILGCRKDKQKADPIPEAKTSWWAIDRDTFRTNETTLSPGGWYVLYHSNSTLDTTFTIEIDTTGISIDNNSFPIYTTLNRKNSAALNFNKSGLYLPGPNDTGSYIYSTIVNGKRKLTLPKTVFRKLIPVPGGNEFSEDTTFIQGEFYEP